MDDLAACRDTDDDLFFDGQRTGEAIKVCMGCPVWAECTLTHVDEQWGVWGASERARRRMRKLRSQGGTPVELLALARRSNLLAVPELAAQMIDPSALAASRRYAAPVSSH